MADETEAPAEAGTPEPAPDPVETHPVASRLKRAIKAHPILGDEKKLEISVEGGLAKLGGTVFTLSMYDQLVALVQRVAGDDQVLFETEPQIKPPQPRTLEGRVPPVSPGAGMTKQDFSTAHLKKR